MDGPCFAVGSVAKESLKWDRGQKSGVGEDLAETGWSAEVDSRFFFGKLQVVGSDKRM